MNLIRNVLKDYRILLLMLIFSVILLILTFIKILNLPTEFFEIEKYQKLIIVVIKVVKVVLIGSIVFVCKKIKNKRKEIVFNARYEENNYLEDIKNFNLYVKFLYIFYPRLNSQVFSNYLFFKLSEIKKFNIVHENKMEKNTEVKYVFCKENYKEQEKYDKCNFLIEDTYTINNIITPELLTLKISRVSSKEERDRINSEKMNTLFQESKVFIIKNKIKEIHLYSTMSTYNRDYFYKNFIDDRDLKKLKPQLIIYNINNCGTEFKRMKGISIE